MDVRVYASEKLCVKRGGRERHNASDNQRLKGQETQDLDAEIPFCSKTDFTIHQFL